MSQKPSHHYFSTSPHSVSVKCSCAPAPLFHQELLLWFVTGCPVSCLFPIGRNISRIFQRAQHECVDLASHLMVVCLHFVRFDYCKFVELDYIPMEAGCMVSMRPTKGYGSSKSPSKGLSSTRSPDRHVLSESSPSTPRSRFVLCHSLSLLHQWPWSRFPVVIIIMWPKQHAEEDLTPAPIMTDFNLHRQ